MVLMAEHTFVSPLVEEFYNSCHLKSNGRFCGVGAKGKGVQRIPMSANARKSNAILRANAAARRSPQYKSTVKAIKAMGSKEKKAAIDMTKGTRPSAEAMKLTNKYGTRGAGAGVKAKSTGKSGSAASTPKKSSPAKQYGSGKTEPGALALTKKYAGTGGKKPVVKKSSAVKYKDDKAGSGKTAPDALELTKRFGARRG